MLGGVRPGFSGTDYARAKQRNEECETNECVVSGKSVFAWTMRTHRRTNRNRESIVLFGFGKLEGNTHEIYRRNGRRKSNR